jgi:predicted amidohydrolase
MTRKISAAAVQFPILLGDVKANLGSAQAALGRLGHREIRLAVLPEMWSTGFDYRALARGAEATPEVVAAIAEQSARLDLVVVGSLPEQEGDALYNTSFVLDCGKQVGLYRKLHLFSPMGEDRSFRAGDETLVVPTSAGRLGMAICYDLRFPELFRKLALDGAEIICLPAQWPAPRQEHWRTLLRARAIENQLFLVAANCCGIQGRLEFFGMSRIISPRGDILAEAATETTEIVAALDLTEMEDYRRDIPAFRDRRPDVYGHLP